MGSLALSTPLISNSLGQFGSSEVDNSLLSSSLFDPAQNDSTMWNSQEGMFGDTGWVSPLAGAAGSAFDIYSGMQNYNLNKDALSFQMDAWNKDYEAAAATTNDAWNKQNERVASSKGEDYTYGTLV